MIGADACLFGLLLLAVFVGAIVGLGWLVLQPLGRIKNRRVTRARFQLLDLFWLTLLLQPPIALFAWFQRSGARVNEWIPILALVLLGTVVGWATVTGALTHAGITSWKKRAAAVLVILPMIGVVIPVGLVVNMALIAAIANGVSPGQFLGFVATDAAIVAALLVCRRLARWIATSAADDGPVAQVQSEA